ncbi:hypothetical protein TREMEDRAFT_31184 [Tremella mesenterica DSM 1558]|uniref:uncharacterized protein n=1 Tax=Tremella mesenterica (strain ATCC 24925 / CBS 8224 / DSM 1558 / NBRC 9311 / NRRL Y-6157 / RJB 2259-6 / UBC 559-6) TaxID=578456 RepID=UPI0003F4A382|nr:uncharacterized protein TREMEDRAFT_31184 [Tremella mesenterica DSM 1558]EIW69087.1 hypothetical protein TREMEDRAFT_31184 [Tremella mesenterica DSM 1558]
MTSALKTAVLNDGRRIPILGFGTGTAQAHTDCTPVVFSALSAGLRHLDSAWHYKNGMYTSAALRESGLKREDVWITSKGGDYDGKSEDFDAWWYIKEILRDLGMEYVDLFLIHADILVGSVTKAWKQMEEIKKAGLAKSIGVSNFTTENLQAVLDMCEIPPAVNQIEFHPYSLPIYAPTLLPLCRKHSILIEAYAPLMSLWRHPNGPVDEVVKTVVSERGGKENEGQVLLMWSQQVTGGVVLT